MTRPLMRTRPARTHSWLVPREAMPSFESSRSTVKRLDEGALCVILNPIYPATDRWILTAAGCSKSPSSKAAGESKPEAYPLGYVEDFDEPRTPLADFFSILLEEIDHNAQMYSMTLKIISDGWHMVQLLPPIDFKDGLVIRQDIPPEPDAH